MMVLLPRLPCHCLVGALTSIRAQTPVVEAQQNEWGKFGMKRGAHDTV